MPKLYDYPPSFTETLPVLIDAFKGKIDKETGHAAWQLLGYGYSQFDTHQAAHASAGVQVLPNEALAYLEHCQKESDGGKKAVKVDWGKLITIALMVLKMLGITLPA